jgi:hypothetical protein
MASSKNGSERGAEFGNARLGFDVIVKPPAFLIPGTKTSSHWPGENYVSVGSVKTLYNPRLGLLVHREVMYFNSTFIGNRQFEQSDVVIDYFDVCEYDGVHVSSSWLICCSLFMTEC